jgi:tetratricopeptide (TPR) repeat protein
MNKFKFSESLSSLLSEWDKEWSTVYPESIRDFCVTIKTDFREWIPRLTDTFSGASLYPDFSREMEESGLYHLWNNETELSLQIFNACYTLYPRSPVSASNLATAHLWTGRTENARKYFKEAFALDPDHPSVSLDHFSLLASQLERSQKIEDIFTLSDIFLELYPKNAELHLEVGNAYSKTGNLEKARSLYKKALDLDPELEEAKENLAELKKKK